MFIRSECKTVGKARRMPKKGIRRVIGAAILSHFCLCEDMMFRQVGVEFLCVPHLRMHIYNVRLLRDSCMSFGLSNGRVLSTNGFHSGNTMCF